MFGHKRTQEKSRTSGGQDPATEPGHRVQGSPATEFMGAAKRRTREGQEKDKRSTRGRQDLDTEPSHRVPGRGQ